MTEQDPKITTVTAFFDQLAEAGTGRVDTIWALVWHFDADGKVDRVVNLSADRHQMGNYIRQNYTLAPLPDRLSGAI